MQEKRRYSPLRTLTFATLSIALGCGGLSTSMVLGDDSKPTESKKAAEGATGTTSESDASDRDKRVFAGLTEEENKQHARTFKVVLREGELSKLFDKGELFDEVAAICGVKIWDQCWVGQMPGDRVLNYHPFAFKKRGEKKVYWYPDIFHDKSEPLWAKEAIEDTRIREKGDILVTMLEERCGSPLDSKCQVRRVYGQGYVLTVRDTGEVIEMWDTLREWAADL